MNRQQKESVVESLRKGFTQSNGSFLVGYRGLTVAQMQTLRNDLRGCGGVMCVAKARLMRRAVEDVAGVQDMAPYFRDQVALVFSSDESSAVAKAIHVFSKKNKALAIVAGCLDKKLLDRQAVVYMASLPSKEVLLVKLLVALQAPTRGLAVVLNMQMLRLLWVLKQVAEKKK